MGAAALRDLTVVAEWLALAFDKEGSAAGGGAMGGSHSGGRRVELSDVSESEPEPAPALGPATNGESAEAHGLSLITF
jgi:hypothetical protein